MAVAIRSPTGDSAPLQWQIQPGAPPTHFDKVDEYPAPDPTDLVWDNTATTLIDIYSAGVSGILPGNIIDDVIILAHALGWGVSPAISLGVWPFLSPGPDWSPGYGLGPASVDIRHAWPLNPATGIPWTIAEVDICNFGVMDQSVFAGDQPEVQQMYMIIMYHKRSGGSTLFTKPYWI